MSEYALQSRWILENRRLYYYGMRIGKNLFHNSVSLNKKQLAIIQKLPCELSADEIRVLGSLVGEQVVPIEKRRMIPTSLQDAKFCSCCAANDFIIPGLEFDEQGQCPMCHDAQKVGNLKSVLPLIRDIPRSKRSRFDVAVFYTGGKDSTFLLYHLAKQKGLRVLAMTWEIPFMSDSAKASIENAKKCFDNVEFITRSVSIKDLIRIYKKLLELSENTCACPSLAYILFYPELVENRVPYFVAGNEPVQILGLYYNHMAPKFAFSFADNKFLNVLLNIGRILTFHPPLKRGQFHTLTTMRQLAYGESIFQKLSGYSNPLVNNVVTAIHQVPELLQPLKRSIRHSSMSGNIPAFVHLDFDEICGGKYDWSKVKEVLVRECGWVEPSDSKKALHTSCKIEKCKDYSQFTRFYYCRSKIIPFSAIEISLASRNCVRTREDLMYEMEHLLGFSLNPVPECTIMCDYMDTKGAEV
ncbi:MAG: hypothetical protein ACI3XS_02365 [Eubacteriales bacterium]